MVIIVRVPSIKIPVFFAKNNHNSILDLVFIEKLQDDIPSFQTGIVCSPPYVETNKISTP